MYTANVNRCTTYIYVIYNHNRDCCPQIANIQHFPLLGGHVNMPNGQLLQGSLGLEVLVMKLSRGSCSNC